MSDEFKMTTGQAHELAMAFGRNGWTNADVKRLSEGDLLARLLPLVKGQAEIAVSRAAKSVLPTEITVAGRTYEILSFLRGDEKSVGGHTMVARAKEMNANLGQEDCEFLLAHQDEIPAALRGKVAFVFPDWRIPLDPEIVTCVVWVLGGGYWVKGWEWLDIDWRRSYALLLRRK